MWNFIVHFSYIYCLAGMISVWITLEMGNLEARREGITLRELHRKAIDEDRITDPNVKHILQYPETVLLVIFLTWWIMWLVLIFKKGNNA